jgi:hypothetical protein
MSPDPTREKIRDIPPTTLRLAPDLRDQLMREASMSGRSLSREIEIRLRASVGGQSQVKPPKSQPVHVAEQRAGYVDPALTDAQRQLVALYEALTPDKQLALLTLLKR